VKSATSNNMKLVVSTLAVDRWAVIFGTARRGLGEAIDDIVMSMKHCCLQCM